MLAMQYSFTLPADYDMKIIQRRIADKGHLMDQFPYLAFKAFLYARRDGGETVSRENLYAPFYVWRDTKGLNDFLCGDGFAALTHAFGRPKIALWPVWHAELSASLSDATTATREIIPILPDESLSSLQKSETERAIEAVQKEGASAAVAAFEPVTWTLVRFRLWNGLHKDVDRRFGQAYSVGHLSSSER